MTKADLGLPSGSKAATYQQNREIQMPAIAFMSKSELRKTIEWMHQEQKKFMDEVIRLKSQRTEDLVVINQQKEKIISLYSKINSDSNYSPLMKAG